MGTYSKLKIGVACGGTGGHVLPGLATATLLKERGHDVALWLAGRDIENNIIKKWDGVKILIPGSGFRRFLSLDFLLFWGGFIRSFVKAFNIMKSCDYNVFLAMGSYASAGPVMAAKVLKIPVIFHEANVIPGRALYFLSWAATAVAVSFQQTANLFKHRNIVHTGYPLRKSIVKIASSMISDNTRPFTIMVVGGSQGATFLNHVVTESLCKLQETKADFRVIHLTGSYDYEYVQTKYKSCGVKSTVYCFLNEIETAYKEADFVISRAGAGSCFEIMYFGIPALLIPYPYASRNHQLANAMTMKQIGGFEVIEQKELSVEKLKLYLQDVMTNKQKLDTMKFKLKNITKIDGTPNLADLVERLAQT